MHIQWIRSHIATYGVCVCVCVGLLNILEELTKTDKELLSARAGHGGKKIDLMMAQGLDLRVINIYIDFLFFPPEWPLSLHLPNTHSHAHISSPHTRAHTQSPIFHSSSPNISATQPASNPQLSKDNTRRGSGRLIRCRRTALTMWAVCMFYSLNLFIQWSLFHPSCRVWSATLLSWQKVFMLSCAWVLCLYSWSVPRHVSCGMAGRYGENISRYRETS